MSIHSRDFISYLSSHAFSTIGRINVLFIIAGMGLLPDTQNSG